MRLPLMAIVFWIAASCAGADELPQAEQDVVSSVVAQLAAAAKLDRPILLLNRTDAWLPSRPADIPKEKWRGSPPIPPGLRTANKAEYVLPSSLRVPGVALHSSDTFDEEFGSPQTSPGVISQRGREPLVFRVSRPHMASGGTTAVIAVHTLYSWTGCGSFQLYAGVLSAEGWTFTPSGGSIIW